MRPWIGLLSIVAILALTVAASAAKREPGRSKEGQAMKNPVETSDASVRTGKRIWLQHCAVCHGADGRGETEMLEFLRTPPPDITKGDFAYGHTDGEIFLVIRDGTVNDMEAFGEKLSDTNMWHLVNFMKDIMPEREEMEEEAVAEEVVLTNPIPYETASINTGKRVWLQHCAVCHGADGRGETEMLEFLRTPPPDFTQGDFKYGLTDSALYRVIHDGTEFEMEAFGEKLSENNIWHVINYLRSLLPPEDEAKEDAE